MKKLLSLLFGLIFSLSATYAQLPNGSIAPDFTVTDINGNTHRLYDYLDQGYTVIMDLSATWCGPCWTYHEEGVFEELWKDHGPTGQTGVDSSTTDDIMLLWFEGDPNTPLSELENSNLGDWTAPGGQEIHFPLINDDNIAQLYEVGYWPTLYTICPNRVLKVSGQVSAENHYENLEECIQPTSGLNAAIAAYNGIDAQECEGSVNGTISATIQNMGTENITNFSVAIVENGNIISSQDYTGSLDQYELTVIDFEDITINSTFYDITITSSDSNAEDNTISVSSSIAGETAQIVKVSLKTDGFAIETYIEIKNGEGNVIWSEGNDAIAGQYGTGSLSPPNDPTNPLQNNTQYNWDVDLGSTDCYSITVGDFYGDGLYGMSSGGTTNGSWSLKDNNDEVIASMSSEEKFKATDNAYFENKEQGELTSIEILEKVSVSVSPSPANEILNIEFNSKLETENATISISNLLGKEIIKLNQVTSNKTSINVSSLTNGIYFVNTNLNGIISSEKIVILH